MKRGDVLAGRFELLEPLAEGGMSVVWTARDGTTGEKVALKVVEEAGQQAIERFGREVRTLAKLRHPHIVGHLSHGSVGLGSVFLAMELLEGEDLEARLARGALSVGDTLALGRHAAEALAAAHAHGIVHRDVKPSNLFLPHGEVGRVKLLDFGTARLGDARPITVTGQPMGTPVYMAPEQAKGHAEHGPPVDVYGLGAVMFECLAGRPPFVAKGIVAQLAKVLFEPAPSLRDVRPDLPDELEALLSRMMSKRPEDRFADGSALVEAIDRLLSDEPRRLSSKPPPRVSLYPAIETRRVLSVVMLAEGAREGPVSSRSARELRGLRTMATALAVQAGGYAELLAEGTPVVVLHGEDDAEEVALRALRVAQAFADRVDDVALGISTVIGGEERASALVGSAIDNAEAMLAQASAEPATIYADATSARLLASAVTLRSQGDWFCVEP